MVGGISHNGVRYVYTDSRPQFKKCAYPVLAKGEGDLCHVVSLFLITQVLCDIMNYSPQKRQALTYLTDTFGTCLLYLLGKPQPPDLYYDRQRKYAALFSTLISYITKATSIESQLNAVKGLLSHLNSCPMNLRYPADAELGSYWNRGIQNSYDCRLWCYVDIPRQKVISDNTALALNADTDSYLPLKKRPAPPVTGYYLISDIDMILMTRLMEMGPFLSVNYDTNNFSIISARANNIPYLASSSNKFTTLGMNLQLCSDPILYYHNINAAWTLFR